MKITLEVIGTFCNSWPNIIVEINGEIICDECVRGRQNISLSYDKLVKQGNKISVGMNNKSFGKNNVWDTKTENESIVADKTIKVLSFQLDDVECRDLFNNRFNVKRSDKQPSYFPDIVESADTMHYNGYFSFNFDMPLYKSLINQKFLRDSEDELSYFSNYTKVFHYDEEQKIINEIKMYLKEVDEKFSHKRTKIRNT